LLSPVRFLDYYNLGVPYTKCPAIQDYYKNFFVVPFPVDFYAEFRRMEDNLIHCINSNIEARHLIHFCEIDQDTSDLQFKPLRFFCWSDKDCVIESWGPEIFNIINIGGSFNIRKWIRPIHASYAVSKNLRESFYVKKNKGDPWLLLKFNTEEKVKLSYNYDKSIIDEAYKMSAASTFVTGFKKYFNKFAKIRPRKLTK